MDVTLVLAGGYWGMSSKLHKQVDKDNASDDRGVDYVLRVKNLPETFFKTDLKKIVKYHCETCDMPVPEWEVENKVGCFAQHKCKQVVTHERVYPLYLYGPVDDRLKKKKPMFKDGMVLWVNQPQGVKICEQIFSYIEKSLPKGEVMPEPVAVGTKNGFVIESVDDMPLVVLPEVKGEKEADLKKRNLQECPHCGQELDHDTRALMMHVMKKHPSIYDAKYKKKEEPKEAQAST